MSIKFGNFCRKLKVKIDKNKVTSVAGVKKSLFDNLVLHMDKYADKIVGMVFGMSSLEKVDE